MTEKPPQPESTPVPIAETTEEISDVISQLETHKKTVVVAILGTAIIFSVVLVSRELASQKHLTEAEAYSQAAKTRNIEELDKVIAEHPDSVAAGNALLTKAELEITSGKTKNAQITLLTFVEKYKSHPRHTQGLFAFGNLYQVGGDDENASKYYDRVLKEDPDSDLAPFALIRQGDLLLAAGKTDEARQKYEAIMPAYSGTSFFDRIEEKLELLKVEKLPVVPEPKKPEPKPKPKAETAPANTPKTTSPPEAGKTGKPDKASGKKDASKKSDQPTTPAEKKPAAKSPKN